VVDESIGQEPHELVDAGVVLLLAFVAMLLEIGVGVEVVEAVDLGLAEIRVERRAVGGDGEGHVALAGFDHCLGVIMTVVFLVEDEALGMVRSLGGHVVGDGAAHEGSGIGGGRGHGLSQGGRGEQKQRGDRAKERGRARVAVEGSVHEPTEIPEMMRSEPWLPLVLL